MNYFYGDNVRWFIATVLNVYDDPRQEGRVQIMIHGIHSNDESDIPSGDFPWAQVLLPVTEGGVSGIGQGPGLLESAKVFGIFLDGKESQMPLVLGSFIHTGQVFGGGVRDASLRSSGIKNASSSISFYQGITTDRDLRKMVEDKPDDILVKRLALMLFFMNQTFESPEGPQSRFTPAMAAGIVGNLQGENSTFDPKLQSGIEDTNRTELFASDFPGGIKKVVANANENNEPSFGLAQWNANVGRFQQLFEYARMRQLPWDDFFLQAEFICHTLYGVGTTDNGASAQSNVYKKMLKASEYVGGANDNNTTWIWLDIYENPANKIVELQKREKFANEAMIDFQNSIKKSTPKQSTPNDETI